MGIAISIEDLTFTYREGKIPALKNIQGRVEDGTFVVVMGHGGSGKSTLCCSLNGLVPRFFRGDYQGRVLVKGQEVAQHKVSGDVPSCWACPSGLRGPALFNQCGTGDGLWTGKPLLAPARY